jgi:outer membrane receptor protein involved in Fe transport
LSLALLADPAAANTVLVDVPAGSLQSAINVLSRQLRISVAVEGRLPDLRTPAVRGRMEPQTALDRLLSGSDWRARRVAPSLWQLVRQRRVPKVVAPRPSPPPPPPPLPPPVDIVVTALKRDLRLSDAPVSISVLGGNRFGGASSARGSSDIAEEAGSVFSTHLGPGRERLFLRGVADSPFNGPTQSTVGLFLDDARINFALPDPDLRLVDIDRVEVIRGPQGTLYGAGALGGIVRIVTNRPQLDRTAGSIALEASDVAHGGMGGAGEAWVNIPLVQDTLGLRAVGYAEQEGGWIDHPALGRTNTNSSHMEGGRLNLRWKPGPDWTIDLSIVKQNLKSRDAQYATQGMARVSRILEPSENDFTLVRIEASGPIGGLDFLSSTTIEKNRVVSHYDAGSTGSTKTAADATFYDETRRVYLISQEFRLSRAQGRFHWLAGVSVIDAINVTQGLFVAPSTAPLASRIQANLNLQASAYAEGTLALNSVLDLTAGLRAYVSNIWDDPRATTGPSIDQNGFSPSLSLSWRPRDGALVWLRYGTAVRAGGRSLDAAGELTTFQADRLQDIELGSRMSLLDGHLDLDLSAFALRWSNVQSDRVGLDGLVVTTNIGNAGNLGVEFGSKVHWGGFGLDVSFIRQHGRLRSGLIEDDDLRLPVLPDRSAKARLSWDGNIGSWNLGAYLSASYSGSSRLGYDPTRPLDMSSLWMLGSGMMAGRDGWRLVASVSNLLDSSRNTFAFGNPFTYRTQPQRTPPRPRTLMIRIERSF